MGETKCTYKCGKCGQRFKISINSGKVNLNPCCPQCGTSGERTIVPAYQYGSWGGPMAPELPKAYFG